jgi:hypothetical protein
MAELEQEELLEKLRSAGLAHFVGTMCQHEVYTKRGRLNRSAACRALGWSAAQLDAALAKCRELLGECLE